MKCEHRELNYLSCVEEEGRKVNYGTCRGCDEVVEVDSKYEHRGDNGMMWRLKQKAWASPGRDF